MICRDIKSGIKNLYSTTFHLTNCQKFYNFSFLEFLLGMATGPFSLWDGNGIRYKEIQMREKKGNAKRERKKMCLEYVNKIRLIKIKYKYDI